MFLSIEVFVFITALHSLFRIEAFDPCYESNQGTLYREKYRGTLCPHRNGKTTFDREITEKWYKVNGVDGPLSMPTEPVSIYHCSTEFPGWMNGSHPNVTEGEVNRTVCFATHLHQCSASYEISVKNCSGYYVYYLKQTKTNGEGYCFGFNLNCPPLDPCEDIDREEDLIDDGSRSPYCSSAGPSLCDQNVSGWYRVLDSDKSKELALPQFCPESGSCGTDSPIWLNDSYPEVADGIVVKTVCVRSTNSCCETSFTIKVKNCSSYYSFNLTNVPMCNQRYCFGQYACDTTTSLLTSLSMMPLQTTSEKILIAHRSRNGQSMEDIVIILIVIGVVIVVVVTVGAMRFFYRRKKRRASSVSDITLVTCKQ